MNPQDSQMYLTVGSLADVPRYGRGVNARPAATVILLRDRGGGPQVLLVKRSPSARFMAAHWVFPGGAVDPADGPGEAALLAAARRELREEAGIELPADAAMVLYARWITPERAPVRFDTWFYLASAPDGQEPAADGGEVVAARWLTPSQALGLHAQGGFELAFPTRRQLEQLAGFASAEALLDGFRGRAGVAEPVMPVITDAGEIVLP